MSELARRLQQEVTEIAEVLARQENKTLGEVWEEALRLHRVRYEREILPDPDEGRNETWAVHTWRSG
jgi:hypothetical protein